MSVPLTNCFTLSSFSARYINGKHNLWFKIMTVFTELNLVLCNTDLVK